MVSEIGEPAVVTVHAYGERDYLDLVGLELRHLDKHDLEVGIPL